VEKISRNDLLNCTGSGSLVNTILISMISFFSVVTFFGKRGRR